MDKFMKYGLFIVPIVLFGSCALFMYTGIPLFVDNSSKKEVIEKGSEVISIGLNFGFWGIFSLIIAIIESREDYEAISQNLNSHFKTC